MSVQPDQNSVQLYQNSVQLDQNSVKLDQNSVQLDSMFHGLTDSILNHKRQVAGAFFFLPSFRNARIRKS